MVRPSHPTQPPRAMPVNAPLSGTSDAPSQALAHLPLWHRVGHALASFSPWLLAFCLTGAYFTMDKPRWEGLNLALCIAMPVILVARLGWVLFGPKDLPDDTKR